MGLDARQGPTQIIPEIINYLEGGRMKKRRKKAVAEDSVRILLHWVEAGPGCTRLVHDGDTVWAVTVKRIRAEEDEQRVACH